MSTCVIMQPTAFPWAGYFNLMAQADIFVFLDDVQLAYQSWQTRNRILYGGSQHWITLNIKHTELKQKINATDIIDLPRWKYKNKKTLHHAYSRHPYASDFFEMVEALLGCELSNLGLFNEHFIEFVARKLDINIKLFRSSEIAPHGGRSDRLISICEKLNAAEYLSPVGSVDYLMEDGFVEKTDIKLRFQDYVPAPYKQYGSDAFVSHLSIFDVVANLGWESTKSYVRGK